MHLTYATATIGFGLPVFTTLPVVYSLRVCIIFTNQYCGFNVHNEQSTAIALLRLVRVVACWWEGVIAMC